MSVTEDLVERRPLPSYAPGASCVSGPGCGYPTEASLLLRNGAMPERTGPTGAAEESPAGSGRWVVTVDVACLSADRRVTAVVAAYRWLLAHASTSAIDVGFEPELVDVAADALGRMRFAGDPPPGTVREMPRRGRAAETRRTTAVPRRSGPEGAQCTPPLARRHAVASGPLTAAT